MRNIICKYFLFVRFLKNSAQFSFVLVAQNEQFCGVLNIIFINNKSW